MYAFKCLHNKPKPGMSKLIAISLIIVGVVIVAGFFLLSSLITSDYQAPVAGDFILAQIHVSDTIPHSFSFNSDSLLSTLVIFENDHSQMGSVFRLAILTQAILR